jgi:hypothetical protein
LELNR